MKWLNKGHEFDNLISWMSRELEKTRIVIFGAGDYGSRLFHLVKDSDMVLGFVDNDPLKQQAGYLGKTVYSVEQLRQWDYHNIIVVVAVASIHVRDVTAQLESCGLILNETLFYYEEFLSLYMWIKKGKVTGASCVLSVTEKCNLNCKNCSILTPYMKHPKHVPLEDLKRDADILFHAFDFLASFGMLGGEPFLYPQLNEIAAYIGENYRNHFQRFSITTNGTVLPSPEMIVVLKKYNIFVTISDYSESLPYLSDSVNRFVDCMKSNQIGYSLCRVKEWFDFGYETSNHSGASEEELIQLFDSCRMPCHLVKNGKLYYCANLIFAINAGFLKPEADEGFPLNDLKEEDKLSLIEYYLGYNEKGYVELCRKCNGYLTVNKKTIPVAEQVPRR